MDRRFLFKTQGQYSGFGDETADLDAAVIFLSDEDLETVRRRAATVKSLWEQDHDTYELVYFGAATEWHNSGLLSKLETELPDLRDQLDNEGLVELPADFKVDSETQERAECQRSCYIVGRDGDGKCSVYLTWRAMPKHTSLDVSTETQWNVDLMLEFVTATKRK